MTGNASAERLGKRFVLLFALAVVALPAPSVASASSRASASSNPSTAVHAASRCPVGKTLVHGRCLPIFRAPNGRGAIGTAAWRVIRPWLLNSTFTDCPSRWPRCAVEYRYGHSSRGNMYFCRLTPSPGSDIINPGHRFQLVGATLSRTGAWGVTLRIFSYENQLTYYTWSVSNTGVAAGLYWGPGATPGYDPATSSTGRLRWVRGARNCRP